MHEFGSVDNLQLDEISLRSLADGEAKLRVKATGISQDQLTYIEGHLHPDEEKPTMPALVGYEPAGIVTEVGPNVDNEWLGKRVAPVGPYDFTMYESLGDEIIVPADMLVEIPDELDFSTAAALWVPYLTASALTTLVNLTEDDIVFLTAATSTVANAAIQIAKSAGATVIGTSRSETKAKTLRDNTNIDHVIVTGQKDLVAQLNHITNGKGVSVAFDPIGGRGVSDIADALRPGGKIIEYGVMGGMDAPLPVANLIGKGLSIRGFAVSEILQDSSLLTDVTDNILNHIKNRDYRPAVAQTFSLTNFRSAYQALVDNTKLGRIVLTVE